VVPFTFSLMTRSKRITWDELQKRDPAFMEAVTAHWAAGHEGARTPLFTPLTLRSVTLPNRLVVSPMCQYSATDGLVDDWHLVHLGSRAVGGAGLVIAEATAVVPEGRITPGCAGIWSDAQAAAWKRIVDFVHARSSAKIGLQLAHAGRKAACHVPWEGGGFLAHGPGQPGDGWDLVAPSALPWKTDAPTPRALTHDDMDALVEAFVAAARRADAAGFDLVELHMAHGYLLDTFLSALTNTRDDAYGGAALDNRLRFPREILRAVRAAWPAHKPICKAIAADVALEVAKRRSTQCHAAPVRSRPSRRQSRCARPAT
jgi:anthraniloyl-CoA monooxygenase